MAFGYIAIIILASILLVKGTHWAIKALNYLAEYLRVPEFVVAFILAGLATSFPEFFVGISSALNKTPILSFSNVFVNIWRNNFSHLSLIHYLSCQTISIHNCYYWFSSCNILKQLYGYSNTTNIFTI
ncbi:hypothetical protein IID20_02600 [Patescibacteria group bacterium]|nr:hypothetical protein [Patescibacteria group bacterium]